DRAGRRRGPPVGQGVRPAGVLPAAPRPGTVAPADPRRRLELRLRPGDECRRGLHPLPAAQAGAARQAGADRDDPLRRVSIEHVMKKHAVPRGLRVRLTVLMAAVVVLTLGVAFVTTYNGTGTQVRRQIDNDLKQDAQTFESQGIQLGDTTPRQVAKRARDYVDLQATFGQGARLYVVQIPGHKPITNEAAVLNTLATGKKADRRAAIDARRLLEAPHDFSTIRLERV